MIQFSNAPTPRQFESDLTILLVQTGTPIDSQCSICLEDTLTDDSDTSAGDVVGGGGTGGNARKGLMFTVCAHVFHSACLDKLKAAGQEQGQGVGLNCPNCRSPITAATNPAAMLSQSAAVGATWRRAQGAILKLQLISHVAN
jgi:hypothetical protein